MSIYLSHDRFETLYRKLHRPEFIHPDPLEFVWRFDGDEDREIVGLIASGLAYGNVKQIEASIEKALAPMESAPASFVDRTSPAAMRKAYAGFKHRWTTPEDLVELLRGIRACRRRYGTLNACFRSRFSSQRSNLLEAAHGFMTELAGTGSIRRNSLLSDPSGGSACKRLLLYLRWMIRRDRVDPGCWTGVGRSHLIYPLDTHMFRIARVLKLTERKQPSMAAALEITGHFRSIAPRDPVRYDFCLTRLGIRDDASFERFMVFYTRPFASRLIL